MMKSYFAPQEANIRPAQAQTQAQAQAKKGFVAALLTTSLLSGLSGAISAAEYSGQATETAKVWTVDMKGKPPYKRTLVDRPVVDIASMEISTDMEMETVWLRETSGRPPFSRKRVEVPVVDAASMQIFEDRSAGPRFRGKPPFRRHR